ncbi:winged helix-turn-helix transcriptional regulator [Pyrobaculum sp. 3827-6]|uniref:TrmB family transcriptional regulator n=1 Tax=Pyrobaculum sp. 3827-6 TaxID=2983604 RepID=UPI0021D95A0F|nr:helix-turn-helix domain-containing protein [Pyrobaculum sp. 3827-6]MCU7786569.1 winged helix-turn-helix transcriptional regulator [Pyrobaculum sp. 3827-6]
MENLLDLVGLSKREVDIYTVLVESGELSARELAERLGIPYTKIYTHLEKLHKMGLIAPVGGRRPLKYRATPPAEVYKSLVNRASEILKSLKPLFDSLQLIYESKHATAAPTFLTLIRGAERIIDLISEILSASDGEAYLAVPFPELVTYRLLATIAEESKRIKIMVLTTEKLKDRFQLPPRVEIRALPEMFGGGAIGNSVLIYVKYGGEISGVYSNERFIIEIAKTYFHNVWQRAKI